MMRRVATVFIHKTFSDFTERQEEKLKNNNRDLSMVGYFNFFYIYSRWQEKTSNFQYFTCLYCFLFFCFYM